MAQDFMYLFIFLVVQTFYFNINCDNRVNNNYLNNGQGNYMRTLTDGNLIHQQGAGNYPNVQNPPVRPVAPRQTYARQVIDYQKYKPRKKNLREKRLIRHLGEDYDPEWMSVNRPRLLYYRESTGLAYKADPSLLNALHTLNFTFQDPSGATFQPQPQLVNVFKDWLVRKASCPVEYNWVDAGEFFWPRWLKKGKCVNTNACSWPPGMRCNPLGSHTVYILRWHCRIRIPRRQKRRNNYGYQRTSYNVMYEAGQPHKATQAPEEPHSDRVRCKWLKVPFPVVAQCVCNCH